jgi:F-type H+-transporting ATPase subunit b
MSDALSSVIVVAQATPATPPLATAPAPATGAPAETGPFPPFDPTYFPSTLLWLAITFVALYFILSRLAIPRLNGILEGRSARIEGDIAAAERMKAESEATAARYEKALADARAGGAKIAEAARSKARAAADAKRVEIEASLNAKLVAAEAEIANIKQRALGEVGTIARDAAGAIVKALTGADVTAAEVGDAVTKSMRG